MTPPAQRDSPQPTAVPLSADETPSFDVRRLLKEAGWLMLAVTCGVLYLFGPVLGRLDRSVAAEPGGLNDALQNVWQLWWAVRALGAGQNPFFTEFLYYPEVVPLFWQTLNITNGVAAAPITATLGPVPALNLVFMASCYLAALSAFVFIRFSGVSAAAAGIGAVTYAFSPFHLQAIADGQLEIASIHYLPLVVLITLAVLRNPARPFLLVAGSLLTLLAALTSHYFGFFIFLYCGIAVLCYTLLHRPPLRALLTRVSAVGVMLLPTAVLYLSQLGTLASVANPDSAELRIRLRSLDLFDIVLPSPFHPLWGDAVAELQRNLHPGVGMVNVSLGVLPWLLTIVALHRRWSVDGKLHAALILSIIVLSMGPALRIAGQDTGLPLPYAFLLELPGFTVGQRTNHFMLLAAVHVSLLTARGIDLLWRSAPQRLTAAAHLLLVLLAVDLLPQPFNGTALPDTSGYAAIPPGDGAVLDIPFVRDDSLAMLGQTVHQRPILGGYLARAVPYPYLSVAGISPLVRGRYHQNTILDGQFINDLTLAANRERITHLVFHLQALDPPTLQLAAQLFEQYPTVYADANVRIVAVAPQEVGGLSIALGDGWYPREDPGLQWTAGQAQLRLYQRSDSQQPAQLRFALGGPPWEQSVAIQTGAGLRSQFVTGNARRVYRLLLPLNGRRTDVVIQTEPFTVAGDSRELGLVLLQLQADPLGR